MPPKLTVLKGRPAGAELALEGRAVFDIGSSPGATGFKIEGAGIAANHIRIFREDKKFTLFDLNGQHVTVNGQKVAKPTVLNEGDEIGVAGVTLKFASGAGAAPLPAAPTAKMPAVSEGPAPQGVSRSAKDVSASEAPAVFYCTDGTDKGKVWPIPDDREKFTMGRGVAADIVIMDIKCSREHCRLERRGKDYVIVDLGSTNGTKINGTKMPKEGTQVLKWGDQVRVGYSTLELRAAGATGATAPTAKLADKEKLPPTPAPAPPPTARPAAPIPPPAPVVAKPAPPVAPMPPRPTKPPVPPSPPSPPPEYVSPAARTQDITFDFGEPPPVALPSRSATTDHVDDDGDGQEALRTFVFEEQPKDFGGAVDRSTDTEAEKRPKAPVPPPPAFQESPLDDYAAYLPSNSNSNTKSPVAPPPPPPPPPPSGEPSGDVGGRTFVFDDVPTFEEKKPKPAAAKKKIDEEAGGDVGGRTFVFDEPPPPPVKKIDAEPSGDVGGRTFVFDDAPTFEEKKPKPTPPPAKKKIDEQPAGDVGGRTFVFDEDFEPPKKPVGEGTDAALRTFVFDENPTFEEPKAEKKPEKKAEKPPEKKAEKPPEKKAEKPVEKKPTHRSIEKGSDAAVRTFVFDEDPSFEPAAEPEPEPEPEEKPDPALRTFVFDETPDFEEPKPKAGKKPTPPAPPAPPPPPPAPPPPPPPPSSKKPAAKKPADDEERPAEFRTIILDDDLAKNPEQGGPEQGDADEGDGGDDPPPDPTLRTFVFDNPPEF